MADRYRAGWKEGWAHGWHAGRASMGSLPTELRANTIDDLPHGLDATDDGLEVFVTREGREYRWCGVGLHWHPGGGSCPPCVDESDYPTHPQRATVERLLGTTLEDWQWAFLSQQWAIRGAPSLRREPAAPGTGDPSRAGSAGTGR